MAAAQHQACTVRSGGGGCVSRECRTPGPGGASVLRCAHPSPTPLRFTWGCAVCCAVRIYCLNLLFALLLLLPVAGCCSELESQSQKPGAMLPPGCSMSDPHYSIRWVQQRPATLCCWGLAQRTLQQAPPVRATRTEVAAYCCHCHALAQGPCVLPRQAVSGALL